LALASGVGELSGGVYAACESCALTHEADPTHSKAAALSVSKNCFFMLPALQSL